MRNTFWLILLLIGLLAGCHRMVNQEKEKPDTELLEKFLIKKNELNLRFQYGSPERKLSYRKYKGSYMEWKENVLQRFTELIAYEPPLEKQVRELRSIVFEDITYHALVMDVDSQLSIPAYLLIPNGEVKGQVMAVHGHGAVEPVIGLADDYHHGYAFELAKDGYMVLCPELRGFGSLGNLSDDTELDNLDYWDTHNQFTLVTEGFQHGKTLIGETIADLVAWEAWWSKAHQVDSFDVAGISYGGDLVLYYPVFSKRVNKIFCSGSLGSFNGIFATCYNAPAHCIPGILKWMDRSDIAGLNAPRPILLHYGELDTPGPDNHSASYNKTVDLAVRELKEIYSNENAENNIYMKVTPGTFHEMDNKLLKSFLSDEYQ